MVATSEAAGLPQMQLRAMTEADLAAVVEIERSVYPFPWTAGIFSDCLRVGYQCTILELDFVLVGYGIIASGAGEAQTTDFTLPSGLPRGAYTLYVSACGVSSAGYSFTY